MNKPWLRKKEFNYCHECKATRNFMDLGDGKTETMRCLVCGTAAEKRKPNGINSGAKKPSL